MVGKEDILLWFRQSASYKRIDVICNLLNMCIPFELRFVGTFVETIGKHSYQELRGAELKANNPSELAAEVTQFHNGLCDGTFRRKVTLYLSLLHSYNHTCAKGIYDILTSSDLGDILMKSLKGGSKDGGNVVEELLLLFTMAINHPAFTFEQYTGLGKYLIQLLEEEKGLHPAAAAPPVSRQVVPKHFHQEEVAVPMPGAIPMCGPPPGIPLAPISRDPVVQWVQPTVQQQPMLPPPSPIYNTINSNIQVESPAHSRTTSPINNHPSRVQQNSQVSRRPFQNSKNDIHPSRKLANCIEEKESDISSNRRWRNKNSKCTENGIVPKNRSGLCTDQHTYCRQQLEALNLDPESSTSSSGRSSRSHSPPPPQVASVPPKDHHHPHSNRINGCVSTTTTPTTDTAQPIIQYPAYTTLPPNRQQIFTFPFQPYQPYPQYVPLMTPPPPPPPTSSYTPIIPPNIPPPKLSCWNCGASGHTGNDCTEPTIDEITRPGNYQVDFSTNTAPSIQNSDHLSSNNDVN